MGEKRKLYFYISRRLDCSQDFVKNKFSLSLKFSSHEKNWDKKKLINLAKLQLLIDKNDQNTNFAKFLCAKWLFCLYN